MSIARSLSSTTTQHRQQQQGHASLAKRLLFPHTPFNDLPPLLSSPNAPPELHAELYDFIALALRAFVNPWWTKITRYDKDFLPEITRILTIVFTTLESRLEAVDLPVLIFNDIPLLITQHYSDYRNAASKISTSYASGGAMPLPQLFHRLQPHMAVSADGELNDEYFRQIVEHILKTCLAPQDYEPETERFIVREIILKVLLSDVLPKITQPWFILKIIYDQLPQDNKSPPPPPSKPPSPTSSHPFSFHTFIVLILSAIQSISGFCLTVINASKRARNTIAQINQSQPSYRAGSPHPPSHQQSSTPLTHEPPIQLSPVHSESSSASSFTPQPSQPPLNEPLTSDNTRDFVTPPLKMLSEILSTDDRLAASTLMHSVHALSATSSPFLHRLLPYSLSSALSAQLVTDVVRIAKSTLFPNGYPAPMVADPTPEEQAIMRARIIAWKGNGAAAHFLPILLGPDSSGTLASALEPLSDRVCNTHLIVILLDHIISVLFPELCG